MTATTLSLSNMPADSNIADVSDSDQDLLHRYFIDRDQTAMERLFKRYTDTAFRIALREMRNQADAEEVVQAAFLNVLTKGNERIDNVRGWIMTTVVNLCSNRIKAETRCRERHALAPLHCADTEMASRDNAEVLTAALRMVMSLPERYRLPVSLHFLDGLPYREVALALALPEETVRKQANRGIEQVRQALAAAGFTAVVVPELLSVAPLAPVPAGLTASIKPMIASIAAKSSGGATGALAAIAKSVAIATTSKVAMTAALLLAAVALVATVVHVGGGQFEPKEDAGVAPQPTPTTPKVATSEHIGQSLAEILDKKLDVVYRHDYLSEVLADLDKRVGLRSAFPPSIDRSFLFVLEEKQISVKQILEKMAADGNLNLELHGDEIVFWKTADDSVLNGLEKKLKGGDVEARCEAVYDLAQLGDKRVEPLLVQALLDNRGAVVDHAISALESRSTTRRYGMSTPGIIESLLKQLSAPELADYKSNLIHLLGCSRSPLAVKPLIALSKDTAASARSSAAWGLGETRDPRAVERLVALLKDADAAVRASAARALGNSQDPRAVEPLVALLEDQDPVARQQVVLALGRTGDPRAIAPLIAHFKDPVEFVQSSAVDSAITILSHTRVPSAVEPLIALLSDADANIRRNAARVLGVTQDSRAVAPLIALLKDSDYFVRNWAICALGNCNVGHDPRAIEELAALLTNRDGSWSQVAAGALRNCAIETLLARAHDADAHTRRSVANGLDYSRDPRDIETLIALSNDEDESVRSTAAHALVNSREPRAVLPLIALAKSTDAQIRAQAAYDLGAMADPRAVATLIALLTDADRKVRSAAASALRTDRDPRAIEALTTLVIDADLHVQREAAEALGAMQFKSLLALSENKDAGVREAVAAAFWRSRDPRTIAPLIELLKDSDSKVRFAAAQNLRSTRDPRAIEPLISLLKDTDANVRSSAASALLGHAGDPRVKTALAEYEKNNPASGKPAEPSGDTSRPRPVKPPTSGDF